MSGTKRFSEWINRHCDGDWEHQNGPKLEMTDNPGWYMEIINYFSKPPTTKKHDFIYLEWDGEKVIAYCEDILELDYFFYKVIDFLEELENED